MNERKEDLMEATAAVEAAVEETPVEVVRDPDRVWRVLKFLAADAAQGETPLWDEVGTAEGDPRWSSLPPDARVIGELFGEGTYMLIRPGSDHYVKTVRVVSHVEYGEADDDEEPVEP